MHLLIAGGGTGGHLFPGIALAQEVRNRDAKARVVFVGTERGIEVRAVPRAGFALELLPVSGLRRVGLLGLVRSLLRLPLALVAALRLVRRLDPDVAVSVGGYAAGPAVLASRLLGVPCVVMEQNAIPGFTNRVLARLARKVFAGLPVAGVPAAKVEVVGNPVRQDLLAVRDAPYALHDPPRVLVFGGSQGAHALNLAMLELVPLLPASGLRLVLRHQTGTRDFEQVRAAYQGVDGVEATQFIDDMATAYRDADLVISRSGATTLAELTVCGRPAVLVPYPAAVDDHQTKNAATLVTVGAAIHLPERQLSGNKLLAVLQELLGAPDRLRDMASRSRAAGHPQAAQRIADALYRLIGEESPGV